ncbi:MAG: hypothetical protein MJ200_02710 [Mycoplasmoidaceae bacterium]|nr:hypothetical protein [Mycoplasmoidaceae bacterium]
MADPLEIDQIIEHPSQIVTRFYKGNPFDEEVDAELLDTTYSMITFKYYPVGF